MFALLVLAVIAGGFLLGPSGIACGVRELRVRARLLESGSDAPLAGARVLPVSAHDLSHGWDPEETWSFLQTISEWAETQGDAPEPADGPGYGGMRSRGDGAVEMIVELWTCTRYQGAFGTSTSKEEPQDKVAALWIAAEGREPIVVRIEAADLRPHERGPDNWYWATYDLGTVVVPVGEASSR